MKFGMMTQIGPLHGGGAISVIMPNFIKIGQTVAKIWRFNGFQNSGRPPSWILEILIF